MKKETAQLSFFAFFTSNTHSGSVASWYYLYRAVDKYGDTIDFMLTEKRDEAAARSFFDKAIGRHGLPERVVIDKSGNNAAALGSLNWQIWFAGIIGGFIEVLQVKYLNNIVEQSHRAVKWKMRYRARIQVYRVSPLLSYGRCFAKVRSKMLEICLIGSHFTHWRSDYIWG